ncbi:hypothetical protein C8R44DRAFT_774747 [Mycena epipterygia]|nr:hypothetical protein C8R44DRAFT_774747 [Mycena epipterygia]
MLCNIGGCTQHTGNFADMDRHILTHYPRRLPCLGCPATFARTDSLKRHVKRSTDGHRSAARKALVVSFNELPCVIKMRGECPEEKKAYETLNKDLNSMFATLLVASKIPKA